MKAMILAAGLGTRLKPLTDDRPKALVKIGGITLLEHIIAKLIDSGFDEIVINVHHFSEMLSSFIRSKDFGVKIHISDESDRLMDTGGGIVKAARFLDGDDPFLVHNVDIITDIDLRLLYDSHKQSDALATLAVGKRESSRVFLFDSNMNLSGWQNNLTGKKIIPDTTRQPLLEYAFSGIHVINPSFFNLITSKGPFSIVDAYLSLCCRNSIKGYDVSNSFVLDVGKPDSIAKAEEYLKVRS
ncbi:MAG: nucleotidyltransferase family protein [Bacteroidales bacterium]|nr:MAG: nucleotidyltransferase family protein [Bacteroidales bacterium]